MRPAQARRAGCARRHPGALDSRGIIFSALPSVPASRILLRLAGGFLAQSRKGAKAQKVFSALATLRLGDFALKSLFYP